MVGVPIHACSVDFEVTMSFSYWSKLAALALLPLTAIAQQVQQAGPTEASAPVPAQSYDSAFANYRAATDSQEAPDEVWRAANKEVESEEAHTGHVAMPGMKADPAGQSPSSSQPGRHAGHGGHTAMPDAKIKNATPKASTSQSDAHPSHGSHHNQGSNNAH